MLWLFFLTLAGAVLAEEWTPTYWNHGLKYEQRIHDFMFVAYEVMNETVHFAVSANTLGWVGFGPSETGSMKGANMCVSIMVNGSITALEYYSTEMATPLLMPGGSNNCEIVEYVQNTDLNETFVHFARPIWGCKPYGIEMSKEWNKKFIAAYGTSNTYFNYHGDRARASVTMNPFYGPAELPPLPDDAFPFDIVNGKWQLGLNKDIYYCTGHSFPDDRRYHAIRLDPYMNVTQALPAQHHHYIAYSCSSGHLPLSYADGKTNVCTVAPPGFCLVFFVGWAMGQTDMDFRPAGYPVGRGGNGAHQAVIGQAHVFHPTLETGHMLDPWGLRLWLTPTMQEYEGTTFGFYLTLDWGIPAGEAYWPIQGELGDRLTNAHVGRNGVVIQGISPHAHGIQSGASLKVIRGGKEIDGFHMGAWDYNIMDGHYRSKPHELRIFPGDRLIYTCEYNSTSRKTRTYWGEGFEDEMCIMYINVYPAFENLMMSCSTFGKNPNRVWDGELSAASCLGNRAPYVDINSFAHKWEDKEPTPSVCLK
jgi:hypothetical protein